MLEDFIKIQRDVSTPLIKAKSQARETIQNLHCLTKSLALGFNSSLPSTHVDAAATGREKEWMVVTCSI